jgi:hypothetical protein
MSCLQSRRTSELRSRTVIGAYNLTRSKASTIFLSAGAKEGAREDASEGVLQLHLIVVLLLRVLLLPCCKHLPSLAGLALLEVLQPLVLDAAVHVHKVLTGEAAKA